MLNPSLYKALGEVFDGEVRIHKENDPGTYVSTAPPTNFGKKAPRIATMDNWGECYNVDCPQCGDTRQRLYFCHRWGTHLFEAKKKTPIVFSTNLYVCHNERCRLDKDQFKTLIAKLGPDYPATAIQQVAAPEKTTFAAFFKQSIDLPGPALPLDDPNTPDYVREYLLQRRFSIEELSTRHLVRFVPAGGQYTDPLTGEVKAMFDDRILMPQVQHRRIIGWQARSLDPMQRKYRYLNPSGSRKSQWLYNFDSALRYPNIVLMEGPTNVWRVGPDSMAIFGKSLSEFQIQLLRTAFGYDGLAVLCLDADTFEKGLDLRGAETLRMLNVFPRGVAVLRLDPDIGDPADHSHLRMRQLIHLATQIATADNSAAAAAVLDEHTVTEPATPDNAPEPRVNVIAKAPDPDALSEYIYDFAGDDDEDGYAF
jgi:hypothetical protein